MWSQRFPLKRWEFYQDVMYRENDYWSFVLTLCFAHPWDYDSAAAWVSSSPFPLSKPWVWYVFSLVSFKWFCTMVCKCTFRTCFLSCANIHSHILMFVDSLCLPETLVSVQTFQTKGCNFWFVVSSLSVSHFNNTQKLRKVLLEWEETIPHPPFPSCSILDTLEGMRIEGVWVWWSPRCWTILIDGLETRRLFIKPQFKLRTMLADTASGTEWNFILKLHERWFLVMNKFQFLCFNTSKAR